MRSQPFFFSFSPALSTRFSFPRQSPHDCGRASRALGDGLQDVGVFHQLERRKAASAFLDLLSCVLRHAPVGNGGREDGDVAGELLLAGLSISTALSPGSSARREGWKINRTGNQHGFGPQRYGRCGNRIALLAGRIIGDVAHGIDGPRASRSIPCASSPISPRASRAMRSPKPPSRWAPKRSWSRGQLPCRSRRAPRCGRSRRLRDAQDLRGGTALPTSPSSRPPWPTGAWLPSRTEAEEGLQGRRLFSWPKIPTFSQPSRSTRVLDRVLVRRLCRRDARTSSPCEEKLARKGCDLIVANDVSAGSRRLRRRPQQGSSRFCRRGRKLAEHDQGGGGDPTDGSAGGHAVAGPPDDRCSHHAGSPMARVCRFRPMRRLARPAWTCAPPKPSC